MKIGLDQLPAPTLPYRGLPPFRLLDWRIFLEREDETERLLNLVSIYRGVLLYGQSGSGKSSLLNAGLLPEVLQRGRAPERIRVFPEPGRELVIERIALHEEGADAEAAKDLPCYLPSRFAKDESGDRTALSCAEFLQKLRATSDLGMPLLIFDQFEELVTLFQENPKDEKHFREANAARDTVEKLLCELLLDESLPVKVVFAFRDDYLARLSPLFSRIPNLMDQGVRLAPPQVESLLRIVCGPFVKSEDGKRGLPGHFKNSKGEPDELDENLAEKITGGIRATRPSGVLNLTEVQMLCLSLWQHPERREQLLKAQQPSLVLQEILEFEARTALDLLPKWDRARAIALLSNLVTQEGTRDIVSRENLIAEARSYPTMWLFRGDWKKLLDDLPGKTGLLRSSTVSKTTYYELTSEFLIPWIRQQQEDLRRLGTTIRGLGLGLLVGLLFLAAYLTNVNISRAVDEAEKTRQEMLRVQADQVAKEQVAKSKAREQKLLDGVDEAMQGERPDEALAILEQELHLDTKMQLCRLLEILAPTPKALPGRLIELGDAASQLAWSPDGSCLAVLDQDGEAKTVDSKTGTITKIPPPAGATRFIAVAFHPRMPASLALRTDNHYLLTWDVAAGKVVDSFLLARPEEAPAESRENASQQVRGEPGDAGAATNRKPVSSYIKCLPMAFSPDGNQLAIALSDETSADAGYTPISVPLCALLTLSSTPGRALDGWKDLYCKTSGSRGFSSDKTTPPDSPVKSLDFSQDGSRLIVATAQRFVCWRLADSASWQAGHFPSEFAQVSVPPDAEKAFLFPGNEEQTWLSVGFGSKPTEVVVPGENGDLKSAPLCAAAGPRGQLAIANDWFIRMVGGIRQTLQQRAIITALAFRPDGRVLASADGDGDLILWELDYQGGTQRRKTQIYVGDVPILSESGRLISSQSGISNPVIYDVDSGEPANGEQIADKFHGKLGSDEEVSAAFPSEKGLLTLVISTTGDAPGTYQVRRSDGTKTTITLPEDANYPCLSRGGRFFAWLDDKGKVHLFDFGDGKERFKIEAVAEKYAKDARRPFPMAFNSDATLLAMFDDSILSSPKLTIFDLKKIPPVPTQIRFHQRFQPVAVAFDSASSRVLVAGKDDVVRVVDPGSGEIVCSMPMHCGSFLVVRPDGTLLTEENGDLVVVSPRSQDQLDRIVAGCDVELDQEGRVITGERNEAREKLKSRAVAEFQANEAAYWRESIGVHKRIEALDQARDRFPTIDDYQLAYKPIEEALESSEAADIAGLREMRREWSIMQRFPEPALEEQWSLRRATLDRLPIARKLAICQAQADWFPNSKEAWAELAIAWGELARVQKNNGANEDIVKKYRENAYAAARLAVDKLGFNDWDRLENGLNDLADDDAYPMEWRSRSRMQEVVAERVGNANTSEDYEKAMDLIKRALQREPNFEWMEMNRAIVLGHLDKVDEQIADFRKIAAAKNGSPSIQARVYEYLASALLRRNEGNDKADALDASFHAIEGNWTYAPAWQQLLEYDLDENSKKRLLDLLNKAPARVQLSDADLFKTWGELLWKIDERQKAMDVLKDGILKCKDSQDLCIERGKKLLVLNRVPEAVADFNEAIKRAPKLPASYMDTARELWSCKQYESALKILDQGVAAIPDSTDMLTSRGYKRAQQGDKDGASKDFIKALEISPKSELLHRMYAWSLFNLDLFAAALAEWKAAAALAANGPVEDNTAGLAVGYWKTGDSSKAVKMYRSLIAMDAAYGVEEKVRDFELSEKEREAYLELRAAAVQ